MQNLSSTALYQISPRSPANLYLATNTTFSSAALTVSSSTLSSLDALTLNFTIQPSTTTASRYNICTLFNSSATVCLDQWGNNASQPALQPPGGYAGQQWILIGDYEDSGSGAGKTYWTMYSDYAGTSRPLGLLTPGDGEDGGEYELAMDGDDGVQTQWVFNVVGAVAGNEATSSASGTGSATGAATETTEMSPTATSSSAAAGGASTSATDEGTYSTGTHLNAGAIAGIVIAAIFVTVAILVAIGIFVRRKRRRRQQAHLAELAGSPKVTADSSTASGIPSPYHEKDGKGIPNGFETAELSAEVMRVELPADRESRMREI